MTSSADDKSETRPGERIAKVMARAGLCSRRDAEAWIEAGRVTVNGQALTSPAFNISPEDDVRVDGERLRDAERTRLFFFHKPRGLVTTARDPEGRPTVFDMLPKDLPRVVSIGRLDINTEGLLLLTNDGGLARVLELPTTGWLRRYRVRAHGEVTQEQLDALAQGITVDGIDYAGIQARLERPQGSNVWLTMGLREGKNREIKRVLEHLGLAVTRLIRVSFGPFELGDLPEGEVAELNTRVLADQLGVKLAKQAGANFDAPIEPRRRRHRAAPPAGAGCARARVSAIAATGASGLAERSRRKRIAARSRANSPRAASVTRPSSRASASTSRSCAPKSAPKRRVRASASSAARPATARAARSRSSASGSRASPRRAPVAARAPRREEAGSAATSSENRSSDRGRGRNSRASGSSPARGVPSAPRAPSATRQSRATAKRGPPAPGPDANMPASANLTETDEAAPAREGGRSRAGRGATTRAARGPAAALGRRREFGASAAGREARPARARRPFRAGPKFGEGGGRESARPRPKRPSASANMPASGSLPGASATRVRRERASRLAKASRSAKVPGERAASPRAAGASPDAAARAASRGAGRPAVREGSARRGGPEPCASSADV